jgi:hypothetical protein
LLKQGHYSHSSPSIIEEEAPVAVDGELQADAECAEFACLDEEIRDFLVVMEVLDRDFDNGSWNGRTLMK